MLHSRIVPRKRNYAAMGRKGGKIGGLSSSPAKVAAVRENGKLGGRPRKKAPTKKAKG